MSNTTDTNLPTSHSWKRNVYILWLAQVSSISSFTFVIPFLPLFIQNELGIVDPRQSALWTGICGAFMALSMFCVSPLWGFIGDRYGRKVNVLRAMTGSSLVLIGTGLVQNIYQLLAFRTLSGLLTGVFSPLVALAVSMAPSTKVGYTTGFLLTAIYTGQILGPIAGGYASELLGFRPPFYLAGCVLAISAVGVLLFVKEVYTPPPKTTRATPGNIFRVVFNTVRQYNLFPVLAVILLVQISITIMHPVLPVLLQEIGVTGNISSLTGLCFMCLGLTSTVSAYVCSVYSDKIGITNVLVICCTGASIFSAPLALAESVLQIVILLGFIGLFGGGLAGLALGLVAKSVPKEQYGISFGTAQSANSLAFGFGPFVGGLIANSIGTRIVFIIEAVTYLLAGANALIFIKRRAE